MSFNLFYSPDIDNISQLPEYESQHCVKVLRMRSGDKLTVTDGKGFFYDCELIDANSKGCTISVLNRYEVPTGRNFKLHIAFSPTKQMDRNEWFIEKATEIGIDKFTPIYSNFSERKDIKTERLKKIAISAIKQSQQASLPEIDIQVSFNDFISMQFNSKKYIAHCYDKPKTPLTQLYNKGDDALILIGPEGDFSEEEVESAIKNGFEPISLGETRLRTETACLVAMHTIHVVNNQ
ncbi:MAG TPA: 16S rRNA (uracil(1498)-N(3))-methyltransferase [Fermentimonas caenicola]|jgi:16S rRNA (uracil1498-N3)-methyltransferase|uniref:Ribosomal RNA small subunit methyltransferase E n=1 Tax=Fermentimonas caenicola TaxID=1562970 RepID=A0A098C133_9BACT|nr:MULTISPECIES: 16S rRNA (uracil(1498)-N(3))-methyltransferase [Lascolabacillus]MBP6174930.1 16S rRNA (uracil(1498)-N(3))-methyltransferase [Fermentimonas sp.]MDI9626927.1 16S rRNA (uracil(1498)-N(3))-methyltransferase [Bacteroidota bacterium]TAH61785.1 MAG: 16S rRNA (uracil(1498)-N(3))-methyltransferase [Fermentimonas caenicola]MBP6196104.1 16S rRNA (uracil(1498)-N(3))-methyltransferase [Fermentimonas sp.]MBP7104847.1 16S rRNA (uracil(1498)-N(3))-methyltransferase [Fermentimonas sp.]